MMIHGYMVDETWVDDTGIDDTWIDAIISRSENIWHLCQLHSEFMTEIQERIMKFAIGQKNKS